MPIKVSTLINTMPMQKPSARPAKRPYQTVCQSWDGPVPSAADSCFGLW